MILKLTISLPITPDLHLNFSITNLRLIKKSEKRQENPRKPILGYNLDELTLNNSF